MTFCELDVDAKSESLSTEKGNSYLMRMIDDVNSNSSSKNADLESKGYGFLPLKVMLEKNSSILFDKRTNLTYTASCKYSGDNLNLYNDGVEQEWIDLYKSFDPSWNFSDPNAKVRSEKVLRDSYVQNQMNYGLKEFNDL